MSKQEGPSFFDYFSLSLATRLLGPQEVRNRLANGTSVRLYWRSNLLVPTDGVAFRFTNFENDYQVVFVDAVFDFVKSKDDSSAPRVDVRFGALFVNPSQMDGVYFKGCPFTMKDLAAHFTKLSIDISSTNPEPLANSMADALMSLNRPINSNSDCPSHIELPLRYKDFDETASLGILSSGNSNLDPLALEMLCCNLMGRESNIQTKEHDAVETAPGHVKMSVLDAFRTWWDKVEPKKIQHKPEAPVATVSTAPLTKIENQERSTNIDSNAKSAASGITQTKKQARAPIRAGPRKRKKRGAISFSKL